MITIKKSKTKISSKLAALLMLLMIFVATACSSENDGVAPPNEENVVEEFTYIEFIFTNTADENDVTKGIWEDEDGFGPIAPTILQHPEFKANTTYRLTLMMQNRLITPFGDLTIEVKEEDDEHQIYFEFEESLFSDPDGIGNIDDRNGAINYLDFDSNGLPLGLETLWTTSGAQQNGMFRAVLGHQPDVKSDTSTWDSGDIDWDITFTINTVE